MNPTVPPASLTGRIQLFVTKVCSYLRPTTTDSLPDSRVTPSRQFTRTTGYEPKSRVDELGDDPGQPFEVRVWRCMAHTGCPGSKARSPLGLAIYAGHHHLHLPPYPVMYQSRAHAMVSFRMDARHAVGRCPCCSRTCVVRLPATTGGDVSRVRPLCYGSPVTLRCFGVCEPIAALDRTRGNTRT
jgi:hypothetical protein